MHDLTQQVPQLIRSELRLAQAEMTEKGKRAGIGIGMFSVAGLLAFFGLGCVIATAILGLAHALPDWLSALIVGVVLFAGAGLVALLGRKEVQQATPAGARARHRGRQGGPRRGEGRAPMTDPTASPPPQSSRLRSRRSASSSPRPSTSSRTSST